MTRLAAALLAPVLLSALPAHAQPPGQAPYYDPNRAQPYDRAMPSYDDDERGYTGGYGASTGEARPGGPPPSTTYAPPAANAGVGGYYGYGDGDAGPYGEGGYGDGGYPGGGYPDDGGYYGDDAPPAPPPPARPRSTRPAARSPYADRIARWRARADACEAGDRRACDGPD